MNLNFEIPEKSIFTAEEVCNLTEIRPYVLRFWETEFPEISSLTNEQGKKIYEYRDVETILIIKNLLFSEKYTVERAKLKIREILQTKSEEQLEEVKEEEVVLKVDPNQEKLKHDIFQAKIKLEMLIEKTHRIKEKLS